MSYGYTPVTPINPNQTQQNIQIVASSVNSNAVTYLPYNLPSNTNTLQYNTILPAADNVFTPTNNIVYTTGVQATPPAVNSSPYTVLGAPAPYQLYNFGVPTTPQYSVYQFAPATPPTVLGQLAASPYTTQLVNGVATTTAGSVSTIVTEELTKVGYNTSPTTKPLGRDNKAGWYDIHQRHVAMISRRSPRVILCGDSIIAGLARYSEVWGKYFRPLNAINCGIGGDRTQHVLWRMENMQLPSTIQFAVLHCGTNNIDRDRPYDIANGVISCGLILQQKCSQVNVVVTGLLPRDLENSYRRTKIELTNKLLRDHCRQFTNFTYMGHDKDWVLENGLLNEKLFYEDHLHLVESGNEKLATSISNIISKLCNNQTIVYSDDEDADVGATPSANETVTTPAVSVFQIQQGVPRVADSLATPAAAYDSPAAAYDSPAAAYDSPAAASYETPVKTKKKKRRHSSPESESPKAKVRKTTDQCSSTSALNHYNSIAALSVPKPYHNKQSNVIQLTNHDAQPLISNYSHETPPLPTSYLPSTSQHNTLSTQEESGVTKKATSVVDSVVGKISKRLAAPSAFLEKIKSSVLQAREELTRKKHAVISPSADGSKGSDEALQAKLIDYSSASDTE